MHGAMRTRLSQTNDFDAFDGLVDDLEALCRDDETIAEENKMPHWMCQPYVRPKVNDAERSESTHRQSRREELDRLVAVTGLSRKQLRKRHRYSTPIDDDNRIEETKKKIEAYLLCTNCSNPRGRNCDLDRCRNCCRDATAESCGSCSGHRFNFSLKIPEWKKEKKTIDVCALKERS